jgi:hypothetical protein
MLGVRPGSDSTRGGIEPDDEFEFLGTAYNSNRDLIRRPIQGVEQVISVPQLGPVHGDEKVALTNAGRGCGRLILYNAHQQSVALIEPD